jgi:hypothetical protein
MTNIKRSPKPKDQTTFLDDESQELDVNFKIYHKKKQYRTDPFFYEHGLKIAEITYKDWKIFACPDGDIRIINKLNGEEITNHKCRSSVSDYWDRLDDKLLRERFEWENNNWFEISATTPEGDFVDLMIAEHSYDDAISSMKNVLKTLMEKGSLP